MKIHKFILDFKASDKNIRLTNLEAVKQVKKVLRLRVGEAIILSRGDGLDFYAKIQKINNDSIDCEIFEEKKNGNESEKKVIVFCAILKKENFEFVIQKGTEIGVSEFYPILTEKTVKLDLNLERLRKIAKESAEQSGRGIVPVVNPPLSFEDSLQKCREIGSAFILHQDGKDISDFKESLKVAQITGIIIGPEGGWSPRELESAERSKIPALTLGRLTLRAETAAILGAFMVLK